MMDETALQRKTRGAIERSCDKVRWKRGDRVKVKRDWCEIVSHYQFKCFAYDRLVGVVKGPVKGERGKYIVDFSQSGEWYVRRAKGKVLGTDAKINMTRLAGKGFPGQILERAK